MDEKKEDVANSLTGFATNISGFPGFNFQEGTQLSQTETLYKNNRWYMVSNDRQLLSELYVEHGLVETFVDQPVNDAFKKGYTITTAELSPEEIEEFHIYIERESINDMIAQSVKWSRLFGGGSILIVTEQNPMTPLDLDSITEDSRLEFKPVDMWELYTDIINDSDSSIEPTAQIQTRDPEYYNYYGRKVHKSRVLKIEGKQAPSFIRPRLRGWGLSVVEKLVRSLNKYFKNQDVVFELLDEAKVDVYKIKGLNSALATQGGTNKVTERVQSANMIKNYLSALVMDVNDEYEQKNMDFSGLAEVLTQIRQGIAADLKMPMTKLFGISSAGFNAGEDDIENYNAMVESEIRSKIKYIIIDVLQILAKKRFGFCPEDLMIEFEPMRELNSVEEQQVLNSHFNRLMSAYQSGAIEHKQWIDSVNKGKLLPVKIDEDTQAENPLGESFVTTTQTNVDA